MPDGWDRGSIDWTDTLNLPNDTLVPTRPRPRGDPTSSDDGLVGADGSAGDGSAGLAEPGFWYYC